MGTWVGGWDGLVDGRVGRWAPVRARVCVCARATLHFVMSEI